MSPTPSKAAPALCERKVSGLRLDQYAGICAALVEGFPLPAALANDGLDAAKWQRAAPSWAAKLAREKPGAPLRSAYTAKLGEAEEWLGREVKPLDEDVESWLGFLGAWSADPAPGLLLERLKLRAADISRIQRLWSDRIAGDEALEKRVLKLAVKRPARLPTIRVVAAKLRPFPWSSRAVDAVSKAAVQVQTPEAAVGEAEAVAPEVAVVRPSFLLSAVLRMAPVAASFAKPVPSFLQNAAFAPVGLSLPPGGDSRAASAPLASLLIGETAMAFELPRGPAVPFSPAKTDSPLAKAEPGDRARARERLSPGIGETVGVFELPREMVLPFARPDGGGAPAKPAPAKPAAAGLAVTPIGETVGVFELPRGPALPFAPSPVVAAGSAVAPAALVDKGGSSSASGPLDKAPGAPHIKSAASSIGETVVAFELPAGFVFPFAKGGDSQKPSSAPARPGVAAAVAAPVAVVAPAAAVAPVTAPVTAPASAPVAPAAEPPALTLEQHASLSAELALSPGRVADILVRYRVTEQSKRKLDRHYAELGAARPEVHVAWERAYRTYYQWLLSQPRRRG